MKKASLILCLCLFLYAGLNAENYLKFSINATLLVFDPEATQAEIVTWLEAEGGYFLVKSDERLSVRFSSEKVGEFVTLLENLGDNIQYITQEAVDMREALLAARSGIKSREEILSRNLALFAKADVAGTLEIEKEVILLVKEIETLKGRLNRLQTETTYAFAEISFNFKKSSMPENIPSSFGWINSLDLYNLKKEGLN